MATSLRQQIRYAFSCTREWDKCSRHGRHQAKGQNQARGRSWWEQSEIKKVSRANTVVKMVRDRHQFSRLDQIQPAWVKEAFRRLTSGDAKTQYGQPYATSTIKVLAAATRDLERAMRVAFKYKGQFIGCFSNADLGLPRRRLDARRGVDPATGERALTPGQAEEFLRWMQAQAERRRGKAGEALRAFEAIYRAGLRQEKELLRGKCRVIAGHIEVRGKGGRWRRADVDLATVKGGFNVSARTLQRWIERWVREAGVRHESPGVHALRGAFAHKAFDAALAAGKSPKEARNEVSKKLGHNRSSVSYSYKRGRRVKS